MKKSKVIVPAMALLLFSTAASVTSTVAWFTSTRTFTTEVGNFSVVETDGNLECTMTPIAKGGTIANGENAVKVDDTAANPVVLTHGSVCTYADTPADATEQAPAVLNNYKKAFVIDPDSSQANPVFEAHDLGDEDGFKLFNDVTITDNSAASKTVDVYVAVAWTMKFKYNFAANKKPVGVYLDLKQSQIVNAENPNPNFTKDATNGLDSAKGFRIAFMSASRNLVWGNNTPINPAPSAFDADHPYVTGDKVLGTDGIIYEANSTIASGAHAWVASEWNKTGEITHNKNAACDASFVNQTYSTRKYGEKEYVNSVDPTEGVYTRVADGTEHSASVGVAERVCVLQADTDNDSETHPDEVEVTCAAWFEGTDPNIVSGTALKCLSANMTFYARPLAD